MADMKTPDPLIRHEFIIPVGDVDLAADLVVPPRAEGLVIFAHGSGSTRHSPRNRFVAQALENAGLGTLLFDLLTVRESTSRRLVFDIELLARRLAAATDWVRREAHLKGLSIGYFGASTGAAAALIAAAEDHSIRAVVSRGGRPDLAGRALELVRAPTLLIVGGEDGPVIGLNEEARRQMRCPVELVIVPGAGHLFEEPGCLEQVASHAGDWFLRYLTTAREEPGL